MPLTVIGNASNLIVRDGGIEGLTMILTQMNGIQVEGNRVIAQAGASYIETTKAARDHSLTGLEFAAGIPGSVGGAIFMNAGAYGGETKNVASEVTAMLPDGWMILTPGEPLSSRWNCHLAVQSLSVQKATLPAS